MSIKAIVTNQQNLPAWNILLMAVSLLLAIKIPFELFLIAYAVLGPIHYLTEINWLNDNGFYIRNRNHAWILICLTLLVSLPFMSTGVLSWLPDNRYVNYIIYLLGKGYGSAILLCFGVSMVLVYSQKWYHIAISLLVCLAISYLLHRAEPYQLLTGILLPTLIHVYVFTLLFMSYGVIKSKSTTGIIEVLLLLMVPFVIILLPVNPAFYSLTNKTLAIFTQSNFQSINVTLGNIFNALDGQRTELFMVSEVGLKIQIFIAFAYLYHYLNWFSKVSLIGWLKKTSQKRILFLIGLWALSISLYAYDYRIGLGLLFFLSLLHVTLEFPLNIVSANGILSFLRNKLRPIQR